MYYPLLLKRTKDTKDISRPIPMLDTDENHHPVMYVYNDGN